MNINTIYKFYVFMNFNAFLFYFMFLFLINELLKYILIIINIEDFDKFSD